MEGKFAFFFFSARVCSTYNRTGEEDRGCTARKEQHNGGNTCYMVNNKNIKHAANPKGRGNEETVESGGLQKKNERKWK